MEHKKIKISRFLQLLLILNLYIVNNGFILAANPESDRIETFKNAHLLRYGDYNKEMDPYSAIPLFEKVSEGYSDIIAQESLFELGTIYLLGYKRFFTIRYDIAKATHYFSKSAEMGHAKSQYFLSFLLYYNIKNGPGVNKNTAIKYLKSSARSGYVPAMLALSFHLMYHDLSDNLSQVISLYKRVVRGDSKHLIDFLVPLEYLKISKTSLDRYKEDLNSLLKIEEYAELSELEDSMRNEEGNLSKRKGSCSGLSNEKQEPENPFEEKINEFEKKIAPENMSSSLLELATMYMRGIGVPKNYENSIQLLERAVSLGNSDAANCLGIIYFFGAREPEQGRSIPVNYDLALKYFLIAARSHNSEALFFIAEIVSIKARNGGTNYYYLELPYIYQLYRLSADYGYCRGYCRCAQMLEVGLGTDLNLMECALNYKTAADQIFVEEEFYLSFFYYTKKNYHAATILSALAAFSGLVAGHWNAAMLINEGKTDVFSKGELKIFLNDALLQGETDTLYYMAKLAESEGKERIAQELYQKGFNSGDMNCLDPLIRSFSNNDIKKAIELLEYKKYRNSVELNNGDRGLVNSYCSDLGSNGNLAFLKMKQLFYNIFTYYMH
ncbi:Sel1 repeat family protein [Theileria parva strain Muguga]|uniref:Sel1 repeat family protein n=1 Tax=Theileria parva strain Muguga TaxID=333668 RepID=UPI001C62293C|nr:Sel1 repeat family protein [Theileria parva strain Muguga]KAF5153281.1 Sel1 repeat family protein [Theileria parva strain Muguga]